MRINYVKNDKTGATGAIAVPDNAPLVEGVNVCVAAGLYETGALRKLSELCEPVTLHAWAKARDGYDEPDEETGKNVARDKLLVKYYERCLPRQDAYIAALECELKRAREYRQFTEKKAKAAAERLEAY